VTAPPLPAPAIVYEGPGTGTELWGMTSANFSFPEPSGRIREVAVQVNDAAMRYIASQLGADISEEFREQVARAIGEAMLRRLLASGTHVPPEVTISLWVLSQHPELIDAVRPLAPLPAAVAA
jgi:hypothetical protein